MKLYRMTNGNYYLWDGKEWFVTKRGNGCFIRSAWGSDFEGIFEDGLTLIGNNYRHN